MTNLLFDITFWFAAPFWALMVLAPRWRQTSAVVASPLICVPPLVIYTALIVPKFGAFAGTLIDPHLAGLQSVLGEGTGAAAAWAHFVALDLFLGRWIFLDSRARGLPPLLISPLLVLTILFAPIGVLLYLLIRLTRTPLPVSDRPISLEA
ncbi:ABA4-like family protein [Nocardia sp. NBC_01730]|uniref:ABA4-like family protein n=1 Tax=Nocardia sp. NBC_01730 TaxID=2975998 RepID=UPI002E0ECF6D|nr:ABA4-like family protein [Nocardia sp. NBC_01730]